MGVAVIDDGGCLLLGIQRSRIGILVGMISSFLMIHTASALDVNISPEVEAVEAVHDGEVVNIKRIQDQNHVLTGGYTKTSRKCPPFCMKNL